MTRPQSSDPAGSDPTGGAGPTRWDAARRGDPAGQGRGTATGQTPGSARWRAGRGTYGLLVGSLLLLVWALVTLTYDPVPAAEDFGEVPVEVAITSTGTPTTDEPSSATQAPPTGGDTADPPVGVPAPDEPAADEPVAEGTGPAAAAPPRIEPPSRRPATLEEATQGARSSTESAPVRLRVGSVGLDVPLDAVGVQDDGQMAIPEDADRAGWYRFGPTPGADEGSAVISGHVDDRSGPGAFLALTEVAQGDEVVVEAADGSRTTYTVVSLRTVAKPELAVQEVFRRDGDHLLQLITCTGPWSPETRRYTDNLVITAAPVDGS